MSLGSTRFGVAGAVALVIAAAGAVTVFAAQPSPKPHHAPSPAAGARQSHSTAPSDQQSPEPAESPEADGSNGSGVHPCNHGWYVSQAAHKHAGGSYVSSVARTDLGKNGSCTAPLPSPPG